VFLLVAHDQILLTGTGGAWRRQQKISTAQVGGMKSPPCKQTLDYITVLSLAEDSIRFMQFREN
jgi:hypothetical protein